MRKLICFLTLMTGLMVGAILAAPTLEQKIG